jgi:hypothetical protein
MYMHLIMKILAFSSMVGVDREWIYVLKSAVEADRGSCPP